MMVKQKRAPSVGWKALSWIGLSRSLFVEVGTTVVANFCNVIPDLTSGEVKAALKGRVLVKALDFL
jgi:hypothetical protein